MRLTVEIEDSKLDFFLELIHNFKDFIKVEATNTNEAHIPNHPLDFVGILNGVDAEVMENLTIQLHQNRLAATTAII